MAQFGRNYLLAGAGGLLAVLLIWSLVANVKHDGAAAPLPYVPLLNPLDLMQALTLLLALRWLMIGVREQHLPAGLHRPLVIVLVASIFLWLNAVLLRSLHHWADIPYYPSALLASTLVQSALSIFWTLLALATMLWSNRHGRRIAWIAGATLMAVVVGKLFLVDLARVGTVERIVSFIVVGGLMLVIGYFSPLPPAAKKEQT